MRQNMLQELTEKLAASRRNQKIIYIAVDVGDHEAVDKAVASAVEDVGQIDILINNVRLLIPLWKVYLYN
jgi:3-hydroxy acid dehydrogenase/malonic semialdehyde reductase